MGLGLKQGMWQWRAIYALQCILTGQSGRYDSTLLTPKTRRLHCFCQRESWCSRSPTRPSYTLHPKHHNSCSSCQFSRTVAAKPSTAGACTAGMWVAHVSLQHIVVWHTRVSAVRYKLACVQAGYESTSEKTWWCNKGWRMRVECRIYRCGHNSIKPAPWGWHGKHNWVNTNNQTGRSLQQRFTRRTCI